MDAQFNDQPISDEMAQSTHETHTSQKRVASKQPVFLLVAWILLLLIGGLFLFASLSDLVSDARVGLPTDHLEVFHSITGMTWNAAKVASPQITRYTTLLEVTYAVHELVFGLLFLVIVSIPFRRRARWAWWACWIPMIANLTYTFAMAHYSRTTLTYSLIADIALPLLLFVHIPAFFSKSAPRSA
ncbi:hypothetical protein [Dictyobacter aurantiacus]|uniref:EXPERA domain-containing protein n=1 Tax=Dictyobacter aurantiacus TaxID=1936993 RepID=A0A401ZQB0_9CHLR|nr:hypothetical protein [Dictyobacter aurantiacus]GCE09088.1 hypothetical protein KDAU_64170 [Dictyobacter aurantiacus]